MLLLLLACLPSSGPTYVSRADVEKADGLGRTATVCAGLTMKEDDTRSFAAEKLAESKDAAASCLCEHLQRDGRWDPAVLVGLKGAKRDDRVACVATLLDDPAQPERVELTRALLNVKAPAVRKRLVEAARADADPEVKAAAVPSMNATDDPAEIAVLTAGLTTGDAAWATNAVVALSGQKAATNELRTAATSHPDKAVRAAALPAFLATHADDVAAVACHAILEDEAGDVRAAAIRMVKSSRNDEVFACLRKRALTLEADPVVRLALLDTLKAAPHPEAAKTLCDAIPFWVRSYVKDSAVEEQSDLDITYFQNLRDYERSYECVEAAVKAGGYSCWGRAYLGARFRELGGKVNFPTCASGPPGTKSTGSEISFGD